MKVLVTGGAGFIGSHIVDKLIALGHQVIVVDNLSTGNKDNVHPEAQFYLEDITEPGLVKILQLERPQYVFHHAAQIDVQVSLRQPGLDAKINILGTINLLDACVASGVKKFIYASSAAAYGEPEYLGLDEQHRVEPLSYYGISKHTPEHYLKVYHQLHGLSFTVLRYANVYGIRQDPKGEGGVVSIFVDKVLDGQTPMIYGDGSQTRDFIYVKDIVEANIAALHRGEGQIVNIGSGIQTSVNALFELIRSVNKSGGQVIYGLARAGDILHSYYDISKAREVLNWVPGYTLAEGVRETVEYYDALKIK